MQPAFLARGNTTTCQSCSGEHRNIAKNPLLWAPEHCHTVTTPQHPVAGELTNFYQKAIPCRRSLGRAGLGGQKCPLRCYRGKRGRGGRPPPPWTATFPMLQLWGAGAGERALHAPSRRDRNIRKVAVFWKLPLPSVGRSFLRGKEVPPSPRQAPPTSWAERRMTSDHFSRERNLLPDRLAVGGKFVSAERRMTSDHFLGEWKTLAQPAGCGRKVCERPSAE